MTGQQTMFGDQVAQVRRTDPRTSRIAAAIGRPRREEQWKQLLRRMGSGPISADTGGRVIGKHRSVASSRFGVMAFRKLIEPAGEHSEPDDEGNERPVLRYRLTDHGRDVLAQLNAVVEAP